MWRIVTIILAFLILTIVGGYFFNEFWIHRYDDFISRQAKVYRLDESLVWSVIYEETYFRAWQIGADHEVGLMQITPRVAREWSQNTGLKEFEKRASEDVNSFLKDPDQNIQVGCWYLETLSKRYKGFPAQQAMTLSAYNAGASRVGEWTRGADLASLSEDEFIDRIKIASTKNYVSAILTRLRNVDK